MHFTIACAVLLLAAVWMPWVVLRGRRNETRGR